MHRAGDAVPLPGGLEGDPLGAEPHLGDSACDHTRGRFASRCPPASTMIAEAVFLPVGVVGMSGTATVAQGVIILAAVVAVANEKGDGCAQRRTVEESAQPFHLVGFTAWRGVGRRGIAFAPTLQFGVDQRGVDRQAGRATVDDSPYGRAVGFAEGCQPEYVAERIHLIINS